MFSLILSVHGGFGARSEQKEEEGEANNSDRQTREPTLPLNSAALRKAGLAPPLGSTEELTLLVEARVN